MAITERESTMFAIYRQILSFIALAALLSACMKPSQAIVRTSDAQPNEDWPAFSGDLKARQYSVLEQINTRNAEQLVLKWRYASAQGASIPAASELQLNPLIIDGVLYGRSPNHNVFAVDAASGKELWSYQPNGDYVGTSYMRGLASWSDGKERRLFFTNGHWLFALDTRTASLASGFGDNGVVDLRKGLGRDYTRVSINAPSPGVVFENLLIMGSAVLETEGAAPGHIRAYDVRSGDIVWTFNTIPKPGEYGSDTWPSEYLSQAGGANAWAGLSIDRDRSMVFAPTGSPTPDFDGSKRKGKNLFGNSVIALDARTGQRRWHYQTVHHDVWDRDLSSAPTLATIQHNGQTKDVVIQASKQGVLYVLDRDTGQPVFPIEEQKVSTNGLPGQHHWPTQPKVSLPEPFTRQTFDENDLSNINEETHEYVSALFAQAKPFGYFEPVTTEKTLLNPGFYGGANWGGGAFNPRTNTYYINATEAPALIHYEEIAMGAKESNAQGKLAFRTYCAGCHGQTLEGFYPYAPNLRGISRRLQRSEARIAVQRGKGRMMSFAHLPEHEVETLTEYLFELDRALEKPLPEHSTSSEAESAVAYAFAGYTDFLDQNYYPAIKPPWGTLNAFDMATGKLLWQQTLGEHAELSEKGIAKTGTRNYGGPVVTAGGLLIIAATMDEKLRIFDQNDGRLLWEYQLPAAGYATPSVYSVNGKQYIVIAASGGKLGTKAGDEYLAFALPDLP
ncbi:MAG: pyrroloquinoline quinone-dependent dehydrogenase [Pseudomonadota bacterium]